MSDAIPSSLPSAGPMVVVGPQFTAPYPMDLLMTKKFSLGQGSFIVTNVNGDHILKVEGKGLFSSTTLLIDNAGNPIVSLRPKGFSLSGSYGVYRGDSSDPKDLLLTVKDSPFFQFKRSLNVFLAHNTNQKVPDFIIKPSWLASSCTIYLGDSSTIIAKMHEKKSFKTTIKGMEILAVSVNPNIDYAFIVALVMVLKEKSRSNGGGGGGADG